MRVPVSTYRLQFNPSFGFSAAKEILSYLADLGISDVYASPVFAARKGSTHGYDVVDPNGLNPELGSKEEFENLLAHCRELKMGWVQDIVPNHQAFDSQNAFLMDVLEQGKASPYAEYFDIEWHHPSESLQEKVLVPFLGRFYGECLEQGEIRLQYDRKGFHISYYELSLPVRIESYLTILNHANMVLEENLGKEHPDFHTYERILQTLRSLREPEKAETRGEKVLFIKQALWELNEKSEVVQKLVGAALQDFNGIPGNPESFNLLDGLLSEQWYRLSFWKVATEEINYRRFFNINQLISVRVEDPRVFEETHRLILSLLRDGKATGVRVDHIDGLFSPAEYLRQLRGHAPDAYLVVEKILHPDEKLPADWPIQGTTGYNFLNAVNGVLCERKNDKKFDKLYGRFTGTSQSYEELVANTKRLIIGRHMAGDVDRLAHLLKDISSKDRVARDITLYGLKRALVEILALFPVYRTYVTRETFDERDEHVIREAVEKAGRTNPALVLELEFIGRFLRLQYPKYLPDEARARWVLFVMRFQQLTGPLMAKGFEDTALYRYNKLLSLNDVGGSPNRFGISPLEFHYFNKRRAADWPHAMNATSTHDTKRGEDVRARLNVLSEIPDEWARKIRSWNKLNAAKRLPGHGREIPDRNDEYFFYQTLVGSYPVLQRDQPEYPGRLKEYIIKAVREAKVHTAWIKPDVEYEEGFLGFVDRVLEQGDNPFLEDFLPFLKKVAHFGMLNSISQLLLKATSPGIPDFYQGSELWDLSLVDPDNRRPVDFTMRAQYLKEIRSLSGEGVRNFLNRLFAEKEDGRIKLYIMVRSLEARSTREDLFSTGAYVPLTVSGKHRNHIIAFARQLEKQWAVVVAPRRYVSLCQPNEMPISATVWEDTSIRLPSAIPSAWNNIFTQEKHSVENGILKLSEVCGSFPVGFLAN